MRVDQAAQERPKSRWPSWPARRAWSPWRTRGGRTPLLRGPGCAPRVSAEEEPCWLRVCRVEHWRCARLARARGEERGGERRWARSRWGVGELALAGWVLYAGCAGARAVALARSVRRGAAALGQGRPGPPRPRAGPELDQASLSLFPLHSLASLLRESTCCLEPVLRSLGRPGRGLAQKLSPRCLLRRRRPRVGSAALLLRLLPAQCTRRALTTLLARAQSVCAPRCAFLARLSSSPG